jgi:hypothetical protein
MVGSRRLQIVGHVQSSTEKATALDLEEKTMNALTRIGTAGASALLAMGLFAAPPAGASDDRDPGSEHKARAAKATCLSSDGKTQGRSMSDPDGMSNGGPDKPGCTTAIDADGNNGSGNDADGEDDNNGRSGLKSQSPPSGTDETGEDSEPVTDPSEVEDDAEAGDPEADEDADKDDAGADDAEADEDAEKDDAEADDAEADENDNGTSDSGTESPDEPQPLPINEAGAGFGLLALLGGIVRLFLRIG